MGGGDAPLWIPETGTSDPWKKCKWTYKHLCVTSVLVAFGIGFIIGLICSRSKKVLSLESRNQTLLPRNETVYIPVQFMDDTSLIEDYVFWGQQVEDALSEGFQPSDNEQWDKYVQTSVAVRLEQGCGRMQNRMVVFQDGTRGCVRYRQNQDQIQGELFSFYLAQLLQLENLAPSTVSLVDLRSRTWGSIPGEVAAAQWSSNRPVIVTKFIQDLSTAPIPRGYRPPEIHLTRKHVLEQHADLSDLAELAQWSDLVVFDYLTANLDRVVNNLYNKQWNVNIMEAPAHNLAKRLDNLLVFLDNESGLLHGYRLLHKYEPYHSLLLEHLCLFRKRTIDALEVLRRRNVGQLLVDMFEAKTSNQTRDVLPALPEKSVKILNERLDRVHAHVARCRKDARRGL